MLPILPLLLLLVGSIANDDGPKVVQTFSVDELTPDSSQASSTPLVAHISRSEYPTVFSGEPNRFMLMLASKSSDDYPALMELFTEAAKQFVGRTRYLFVDTDDEFNERFATDYSGLHEGQAPVACAFRNGRHGYEKYLPDMSDVTTANIIAYNERFLENKIKRYLRSEEIPEDWDSKPVKILVGKNFHEVIKNSGKSAFVFFTSPWSPYCKVIEPTWNELGEKFVDSENVLIAKINTAHHTNQVEGLHINGQPICMFFPVESSEPIEYNGGRDLNDLVEFVNEQLRKVKYEL